MTDTAHRPWPLPLSPWLIGQQWDHLLFAHWPVAAEALRPLIPARLELDTFEKQAWLGIVPFDIRVFRLRGIPLLPAFLELNVRTYVTAGGRPGVWFFSLDAANALAVSSARWWYHLPYFNAAMSLRVDRDTVAYASRRTHHAAPSAEFEARYRPVGAVYRSQPGTLDHWLTERYCLYAADRSGRLYRGEIHHAPWPLQPAEAELRVNTMTLAHGVRLPDTAPLLHYARRLEVAIWPVRAMSV